LDTRDAVLPSNFFSQIETADQHAWWADAGRSRRNGERIRKR